MFTRFRKTARSLQVSLIETRRVGGKVLHEHIASLGSIGILLSRDDRIAFWARLPSRLAALGNRIDDKEREGIIASLGARIAMPTPDELQAVRLENAKADVAYWGLLRDAHAGNLEAEERQAAFLTQRIPERREAAENVKVKAEVAAERLARAEQGEAVGRLARPVTLENLLTTLGWKPADLRHALRLVEIEKAGGHDDLIAEIMKRKREAEKAASRAVLTKRRRSTRFTASV